MLVGSARLLLLVPASMVSGGGKKVRPVHAFFPPVHAHALDLVCTAGTARLLGATQGAGKK